jgi:hypothetical protein
LAIVFGLASGGGDRIARGASLWKNGGDVNSLVLRRGSSMRSQFERLTQSRNVDLDREPLSG